LKAWGLILASWGALAGCSFPGGQLRDFGRRPDWSLSAPDGKKVSAVDYDRKVVLLDFWATWCIPCRQEVPGLIELQERYRDRGLAVVGFSFDRDPDVHDRWVRANRVNYPSLFARTQEGKAEVAKFETLIGPIDGYPTTLIIDREGRIVYKHVGYASMEDFEAILKPLF